MGGVPCRDEGSVPSVLVALSLSLLLCSAVHGAAGPGVGGDRGEHGHCVDRRFRHSTGVIVTCEDVIRLPAELAKAWAAEPEPPACAAAAAVRGESEGAPRPQDPGRNGRTESGGPVSATVLDVAALHGLGACDAVDAETMANTRRLCPRACGLCAPARPDVGMDAVLASLGDLPIAVRYRGQLRRMQQDTTWQAACLEAAKGNYELARDLMLSAALAGEPALLRGAGPEGEDRYAGGHRALSSVVSFAALLIPPPSE